MRAKFAERHGITVGPERLHLGSGVVVDVDIVDVARSVLGEIYVHSGEIRGGQLKKIATDSLKLITLQRLHPDARLFIVLTDPVVERRARSGWLGHALTEWGIIVETIELAASDVEALKRAQTVQGFAVGKKSRRGDRTVTSPASPEDRGVAPGQTTR